MFSFLAIVWWLDRYDREPIWLLAITFLWGAVGSVIAAVLGSVAISTVIEMVVLVGASIGVDLTMAQAVSGPVVVAPLVEEPAKALILLFVIFSRHFDNMTDGFVYGAAVGLGFGMTENLMYFVGVSDDFGAWGSTVLIRTFYSAVMHATASAIVGASLGFARFRGLATLVASGIVGLTLAIAVHALWNGLITVAGLTGGDTLFFANLVLFPVEVAVVFVVFQICLLEESWTIRRELTEESEAGRLPEGHPRILSSWTRRLSRSWVPAGVNHGLYVQTATTLAMRKKQVRQMGRRAPPFYTAEVDRLRRRLKGVLKGAGRRKPS
ncbi:MAG: PrsW family intramembrane metalloprotease [Myxococcales bacterium]|nr:PrsW family intramembrane metalloprotease [Myxococcales bacterium]